MLTCPVCGRQGLSLNQKLWLGPARSLSCRHCGERLTVPFSLGICIALCAPIAVNTLFIRDPELALVAWVGGYLVAAWLQETLPLVRWTPEHAAMANVRPSKILRVVIGGVLGIAVGPAIGYAFNLQHYVVPLVAAPLILVPLAFYCIPNHRTFLLLTVSVIVGIGGLVLLGKYQEQRFIAKTIEGLKPKLLTPTLE